MMGGLRDRPNGHGVSVVVAVQAEYSLLSGLVVVDSRAEGAVALGAGLAMAGAGGTRRPLAVRAGEDRRRCRRSRTVLVGSTCLWMGCH